MPRTVLVVDDERDTNDILASLVQARGFQPIQVFTGAETLEAVAEQKPDLILLDVMLPDADGFELCDRLKHARNQPDPDRDGHRHARRPSPLGWRPHRR